MIGEFNLYGIFLPWLLVLAVVALLLRGVVHKMLAATGIYRHVWHPALFDLAIFVLILYGLNTFAPLLLS